MFLRFVDRFQTKAQSLETESNGGGASGSTSLLSRMLSAAIVHFEETADEEANMFITPGEIGYIKKCMSRLEEADAEPEARQRTSPETPSQVASRVEAIELSVV